MSFETKRAKSKLTSRLTRVYAALFSAIFFVLSALVFLLAYRFLLQHQYDHLINTSQLTPVEDKYFDGTANPNYVGTGLENWSLGQAVMFLSEYVSKTGEQAIYQTVLQRAAVMMANRIENWAQPANGGTAQAAASTTWSS